MGRLVTWMVAWAARGTGSRAKLSPTLLGVDVVAAPDKFAGTLTAADAAAALAAGWREARPADDVRMVPMADGGVGTLAVVEAVVAGAVRHELEVADPLGRARMAAWLSLPDGTAVVEAAEACGLHLLEDRERDPLRTTTYGVGQLLRAAVAAGARRVIVALGGSATVDGGAGALTALGYRLLRADGNGVRVGGRWVGEVSAIVPVEPLEVELVIASDVTSPLHGPDGAAAVFGPQKGADAEGVALLKRNLETLAAVVVRDLGLDPSMAERAGAGAAGGLGFGLLAIGGHVLPGAQVVADLVGLEAALVGAGALLTGEGALDAQSATGKAPWHVLQRGRAHGVPVLAVAGRIEDGAGAAYHRAVALGPEGTTRAAELVRERAAELARGWEQM